MQHNYFIPEE